MKNIFNNISGKKWGLVIVLALFLAIGSISASVVFAESMPYASWKDNMQQEGNTYTLDKPKADDLLRVGRFAEEFYIYNADWPIHIVNPAGDRCDTGETAALLRPAKHEWIHLGRAVVEMDAEKWARYFNGNPDFVRKADPIKIEEYNGSGTFERYYIRDMTERSGGIISIEQSGEPDQDGFQEGIIVVQQTSYPGAFIGSEEEAKNVSFNSNVHNNLDEDSKGYVTYCQ